MSLLHPRYRWSRTARTRKEMEALRRHVKAYADDDDSDRLAVGVLRTLDWLLDGAPRPWWPDGG